jgi:multidrug transporter EmrE-like cation transporter
MHALVLLTFGGIILTIGDIIFKFYALNSRWSLYAVGLLVYLIGEVLLVQTYKTENIAVASTVFVVANVISLLLVSCLYFHESLSVARVGALFLALISIVILEVAR